jgi:hypothetical protein
MAFASLVAMIVAAASGVVAPQPPETWQVHRTEHFEIYVAPDANADVASVAAEAEQIYKNVSASLNYALIERVPLLLLRDTASLPRDAAAAAAVVRRSGAPPRDHLLLAALPLRDRRDRFDHELRHVFEIDMRR